MIKKMPPVVALATVLVLGCGHAPALEPCADPEPIEVRLRAAEMLNPDDAGRPLPTIVRVLQLRGAEPLETASADSVRTREQEILGDLFIKADETTLDPGVSSTLGLKRHPEARYLAVVALFRKPQGLSWRLVEELPAADVHHCRRANKPPLAVKATLTDNRVEEAP
jgi:type VI secretion system protein VasD